MTNAIPTSEGTGLSKKSVPAPTLIYSHNVIPYPRALGTLFFGGLNVTHFLDRYHWIYINYRVNDQEKIKRLSYDYKMFTGECIEIPTGSCETNWAALRQVLLEEF